MALIFDGLYEFIIGQMKDTLSKAADQTRADAHKSTTRKLFLTFRQALEWTDFDQRLRRFDQTH